jgi:hypothetical protein
MIFFNLVGLVMLAFSIAVSYLLEQSGQTFREYSLFSVAAGVFVVDVVYRFFSVRPRIDPRHENWLTSGRGGSLMLLPAWLCAIVGAAVLSYFELS